MNKRLVPLALVMAGVSASFTHAALTTSPAEACHTVLVGEETGMTAEAVSGLLDAGYVGRAGDGAERLYSPACPARSVPSHSWCIVWAEGEIEEPREEWADYCEARPELWTS